MFPKTKTNTPHKFETRIEWNQKKNVNIEKNEKLLRNTGKITWITKRMKKLWTFFLEKTCID